MVRALVQRLRDVPADRQLRIASEQDVRRAARLLPEGWRVIAQGDGDLGSRLMRFLHPGPDAGGELDGRVLSAAIRLAAPNGRLTDDAQPSTAAGDALIAIGADCPLLTSAEVVHAFEMLERPGVACVLGETFDGGYYLIGCRGWNPAAILRDMPWGTASVWSETIRRLAHERVRYQTLPKRRDVDRADDLPWLARGLSDPLSVEGNRPPSNGTRDSTASDTDRSAPVEELAPIAGKVATADGSGSTDSQARATARLQQSVRKMTETGVLIVGGGAIGLSLAYELAGRGHRVKLLDRGDSQQRSSWAGAGILPPTQQATAVDPLEQLRGLSHAMFRSLSEQLREETGIDIGYRACGGIYLATTAGEAATLAALAQYWQAQSIAAERWSVETLVAAEPQLATLAESGRLRAAWFAPSEAQVRNPRFIAALELGCRRRGVDIEFGADVREIVIANGRAIGVAGDGRQWHAARICLCGGAWTRMLLERHGLQSGILPVRGQMLLYRFAESPFRSVINEGHRYLVARDDGHLLVGSNEEEVGYRLETTREVLEQLGEWASSIWPVLSQTKPLRGWAGLRPGTIDGLPYLGSVPGLPGVFLAAGHYRAGLHLSPGTALVMADLIEGRVPPIELRSFRLSRGG
jgi:glycine oxidase